MGQEVVGDVARLTAKPLVMELIGIGYAVAVDVLREVHGDDRGADLGLSLRGEEVPRLGRRERQRQAGPERGVVGQTVGVAVAQGGLIGPDRAARRLGGEGGGGEGVHGGDPSVRGGGAGGLGERPGGLEGDGEASCQVQPKRPWWTRAAAMAAAMIAALS